MRRRRCARPDARQGRRSHRLHRWSLRRRGSPSERARASRRATRLWPAPPVHRSHRGSPTRDHRRSRTERLLRPARPCRRERRRHREAHAGVGQERPVSRPEISGDSSTLDVGERRASVSFRSATGAPTRLDEAADDVDQSFELGRGRWQFVGTMMAGSRQRPPCEVHLVRGLRVLEVGLETEQLHPNRSAVLRGSSPRAPRAGRPREPVAPGPRSHVATVRQSPRSDDSANRWPARGSRPTSCRSIHSCPSGKLHQSAGQPLALLDQGQHGLLAHRLVRRLLHPPVGGDRPLSDPSVEP